jgi:hypothetical protein
VVVPESWLAATCLVGTEFVVLDEFWIEVVAESLDLLVACPVPFVDDLVVVRDRERSSNVVPAVL